MLDFIRIACAVPAVRVADVKKNAEAICAYIAEADAKSCDILLFLLRYHWVGRDILTIRVVVIVIVVERPLVCAARTTVVATVYRICHPQRYEFLGVVAD